MKLNRILKLLMLLCTSATLLVQCKKEATPSQASQENKAPVANAGADKIIVLPTDTVQLDGSASNDPDGNIVKYEWTKINAPTGDTSIITNDKIINPIVKGLTEGSYSFQLTVTDNKGASDNKTINIIVSAGGPNRPPFANAVQTELEIKLPVNAVTVDGSASRDSDGSIVKYEWTKADMPAGDVVIDSPNSVRTMIVGLIISGTYLFQLKVTDNKGMTDSVTVRVTVYAANIPPIANAGRDQIVTLPTTNKAVLDGSGSYDSDGHITGKIAYEWKRIKAPLFDASTLIDKDKDKAVASDLNLVGNYDFELTVTDDEGASTKDTVNITVKFNQSPIANAGTNRTIQLPKNTVTLDGSASYDPDGIYIRTYKWTKLYGPPGSVIENPNAETTVVKGLVVGDYSFKLTVIDLQGASNEATVDITVNKANEAPVANAGTGRTITLPVKDSIQITLKGDASYDPDGTIKTYKWTKIKEPTFSTLIITDGNSVNTTVDLRIAGDYSFKLTVTDDKGASNSDIVNVTLKIPLPGTWDGTSGSTTLKLIIAADESMLANVNVDGTTRTNLKVNYMHGTDPRNIKGSFEVEEAGKTYSYSFDGHFNITGLNQADYEHFIVRSLKLNGIEYLTTSNLILLRK